MSKYGSEFIEALHPAKYNYIDEMEDVQGIETDKIYFGVMAQDIVKYLESVSDEDFSIVKETNGKMSVDYIQLIAPMLKTIQELTERVNNLEKRVR